MQSKAHEVQKVGPLLPATFLSSSSSLLSSLLSEESLSLALLAAGAAGAFWIDAGGGTALYVPIRTEESGQHCDMHTRPSVQYFNGIRPGDLLWTVIKKVVQSKPGLSFLLGGASSSDEESSLLDSAAAAFPGAGLTGAYQDMLCKQLHNCYLLTVTITSSFIVYYYCFYIHSNISENM